MFLARTHSGFQSTSSRLGKKRITRQRSRPSTTVGCFASAPLFQTIWRSIVRYIRGTQAGREVFDVAPGAGAPTDGDPGQLASAWYEYTPTGALDIAFGETMPDA